MAHRTRGATAWLREPLLHFLLAGAVLFAVGSLGREAEAPPGELRVGAGQVEHLAEVFARAWSRPPTREELDGLIRDHLREEVAYREALALGLDRDDTIVRRRLRQKLEFLAEDVAVQGRAGEAELAAFFDANRERFRREPRYSFRHVYFSSDRRRDASADARAALARLEHGEVAAEELGDPTLLPLDVGDADAGEVDRQFGDGFAHALAALPTGTWRGPIESAFGVHLVRVERRDLGSVPPLSEVREAVEREWLAELRSRQRDEFYQRLLARYRVVIEPHVAAEPSR